MDQQPSLPPLNTQPTPPAPTIVSQPPDAPPPTPKSKKSLIIAIVIWLGSIPLAIILSVIARIAAGESGSMPGFVNIIVLLLGFYFFLGWIPVLIIGLKNSKKP